MALDKKNKQEIINKFKLHEKDSGSPEVQLAIINERLNVLSTHFLTHKKDNHSRRGLLRLVGQRRSLLDYLKQRNRARYDKIIVELGLRK